MCVWGSMPPVQKYISDMQLKLKVKAIMLQGIKHTPVYPKIQL